MKATAKAHPNIALIKYWGKRDHQLNLPAVGSISLTLREMRTVTSVCFREDLAEDSLILDGQKAEPEQTGRVSRFLDIIRKESGILLKAEVVSENDFPTSAGLASSASAFASLAVAGSRAAGLELPSSRLSELARLGSGSAARSIFGGFVEMNVSSRKDGADAVASQLADERHWDIRILVAITSEGAKEIGSTEGMNHTATTSPYYQQWVSSSHADIEEMRRVILDRDFDRMGELAEFSCLKMHAVALSARPGLVYWNGTTLDCLNAIRDMRKRGTPVYFTIDAGPQVKTICLPDDVELLTSKLGKIRGVKRVIVTSPGPGAAIVEDQD